MRLHVDIFIKYVSYNVYSDNNHGQPQSILNIFLTFLVAYTLWQPFVAYFRSDIYIIGFFLWGGMKTSGSAGLFNKTKYFFYLVGSPKVGGAGDGKHNKNTATLRVTPGITQSRGFMWIHSCFLSSNLGVHFIQTKSKTITQFSNWMTTYTLPIIRMDEVWRGAGIFMFTSGGSVSVSVNI